MNEFTLDYIREKHSKITDDSSEADISHKIVDKFLIFLGYDEDNFHYEGITKSKKFYDILIDCPNNKKLVVEVKRINHIFTDEDKAQLSGYINDKKAEWGILTNGNEYLLMNNLISGINSSDSCCLKYELIKNYTTSSKINDMILKYFSYKYIFEKRASKYFAEFQGFKVKSLSNSRKISIQQYQSANYNFFEYITNSINYAVNIDDLKPRYLIEYFRFLLEQKKLKPVTIVNKYRYIKSFVDFLEKEDILNNKNDFTKITESNLMEQLNLTIENIVITPVTEKEINLLLDYQKNDTRNGLRNILITKLICYLALDINTLSNIKFDDLKFNKKSCSLLINNRTVPIPESMIDDFIKYKKQWEKDKVKIPYLFYTTYKEDAGKHRQIKTGTIHEIINLSFNKIKSIEESRRKSLTYSLLKASVIKYLYGNNFSLEEISAFTGLNIDSILKYLSSKEINKRCTNLNNHLQNNHPLSKIF